MTTDVHELLQDSAPRPTASLDMQAINGRAVQLRRSRRAGRAALALAAVLVVSSASVFLATSRSEDHHRVVAPSDEGLPFDARGDTVELPADWHQTAEPLTQLIDPHEILTVSTFPLPAEAHDSVCVGDAPPASALANMANDDAAIWLIEWTPLPAPNDDLVPNAATTEHRPSRFTPEELNPRECVTEAFPHLISKELTFEDQGRVFSVYVMYGVNTSPDRQQEVYRTLDSLVFRAA